MITHLSAMDLGAVAARGASLEVNAQQFTALDLGAIAARLTAGSHLKVHNSAALTALDMGTIAARKPGQVVFT